MDTVPTVVGDDVACGRQDPADRVIRGARSRSRHPVARCPGRLVPVRSVPIMSPAITLRSVPMPESSMPSFTLPEMTLISVSHRRRRRRRRSGYRRLHRRSPRRRRGTHNSPGRRTCEGHRRALGVRWARTCHPRRWCRSNCRRIRCCRSLTIDPDAGEGITAEQVPLGLVAEGRRRRSRRGCHWRRRRSRHRRCWARPAVPVGSVPRKLPSIQSAVAPAPVR